MDSNKPGQCKPNAVTSGSRIVLKRKPFDNTEAVTESPKLRQNSQESITSQVKGIKMRKEPQKPATNKEASMVDSVVIDNQVGECSCVIELNRALVGVPYFSNFPQRLKDQEDFCNEKLRDVDAKLRSYTSEIVELRQTYQDYERQISEARTVLEETVLRREATQRELEYLQRDLELKHQRYETVKDRLTSQAGGILELELQIRTKQCEEVKEKLEILRNQHSVTRDILEIATREISSLENDLRLQKAQLAELEETVKSAKKELDQTELLVTECSNKLEDEKALEHCGRTELDRVEGERQEILEILEDNVKKRNDYIGVNMELEKHLLKLSFIRALHALEKKAKHLEQSC